MDEENMLNVWNVSKAAVLPIPPPQKKKKFLTWTGYQVKQNALFLTENDIWRKTEMPCFLQNSFLLLI